MLIGNILTPDTDASFDDNVHESNNLGSGEAAFPEGYAHSAVLLDGSVAELIRDPDSPDYTLFACYKDGAISYLDHLSTADEDILPMPLRGTLKRLRLPLRAEPAASLKTLVFSISDLIRHCVSISEFQALILAHFVVSTWIVDRLPIAPYVAVVGLPQTGKTTLLRLLTLLCRRALLSSDLSVHAFCHVCDTIQPTLILDDVPHNLCRLLRAGNTRNTPVFRGSQSWDLFGAKVLAWTSLPDDYALNSRCLIFSMDEAQDTSHLARPDAPEIIAAADDIQAQLLYFRLETLAKGIQSADGHAPDELAQNNEADSSCGTSQSASTLRPRMRDLYQALAIPFANDPDQCRLIQKWMSGADLAFREPLPPQESAVLAALFNLAHPKDASDEIFVGRFATEVNSLLVASGERMRLTPRRIGGVLSSFGLGQRCRSKHGWILWLSSEDVAKIHRLVEAYGIDVIQPRTNDGEKCPLCSKTD